MDAIEEIDRVIEVGVGEKVRRGSSMRPQIWPMDPTTEQVFIVAYHPHNR
jgi:hypothetical protein